MDIVSLPTEMRKKELKKLKKMNKESPPSISMIWEKTPDTPLKSEEETIVEPMTMDIVPLNNKELVVKKEKEQKKEENKRKKEQKKELKKKESKKEKPKKRESKKRRRIKQKF